MRKHKIELTSRIFVFHMSIWHIILQLNTEYIFASYKNHVKYAADTKMQTKVNMNNPHALS